MHRLAEQKPEAREAQIVRARRVMMLGDHRDAITRLEPLLRNGALASDYALMGEAVAGLQGEAAARLWFVKAAMAPRDPTTGADGRFHFTRDGWARVIREYMQHGRLAPPPLEEALTLSPEEIGMLAAPRLETDVRDTDEIDDLPDVAAETPADKPPPVPLQLIDGRPEAASAKVAGTAS